MFNLSTFFEPVLAPGQGLFPVLTPLQTSRPFINVTKHEGGLHDGIKKPERIPPTSNT